MVCNRAPAAAPTFGQVGGDTGRVPVASVVRAGDDPVAPSGGINARSPASGHRVPVGRSDAAGGEAPRRQHAAAVIAILVAVACAAGVAVAVTAGSGGGSEPSVAAADDDTGFVVDDAEDPTEADDVDPPHYTTDITQHTEPTTTTELERSATLFSGDAKVRSAPSLGASDLGRVSGRQGASLDVLGEPTAEGWYEIRIDGLHGYLFGAFVVPPARGYCVGISAGATPYVVDGAGNAIPDEKSGNKVLMTASAPSGGFWPVVLPGGSRGFVSEGELRVEACG